VNLKKSLDFFANVFSLVFPFWLCLQAALRLATAEGFSGLTRLTLTCGLTLTFLYALNTCFWNWALERFDMYVWTSPKLKGNGFNKTTVVRVHGTSHIVPPGQELVIVGGEDGSVEAHIAKTKPPQP
jgi:hypothetical protein